MVWVKHPTISGDGEVSIATAQGSVTRKMIQGIFEWPDGVPIHNKFTQADGPEELVRERRRQQVQQKVDELKALGIDVPDSLLSQLEDTDTHAATADIAEKERAVEDAQAAYDADTDNEELKKALTAAKTALTKAKKAAEK